MPNRKLSTMKKLTLSISILLFSLIASAQYNYTQVSNVDKVDISYKWRNTKLFDTDSPLELAIKLKNRNDSSVQVSFSVDYYINGLLDGTTKIEEFCIKKNKTARGEYNGLLLTSEGKTEELVTSEEFKVEFNSIDIKKVPSCDEKE